MTALPSPVPNALESLGTQVRRAVIWRSGSQIVAQLVQWAATFLVIWLLDPHDYGLFAMMQVVLTFLNMLNGCGLASGLIQAPEVTPKQIRQLFGMLVALNIGLAAAQLLLASLAATYHRQPVVADVLRLQALLYLTTLFVALPFALLSRQIDFRHQASANIAASVAVAAALGDALGGLGVRTLVMAPLVLFAIRGAMMTWSARSLVWPSFDFRGAGGLARYGGIVAVGQIFWFARSQADVLIAGPLLTPHLLGIYTTSLFLAQIFVTKIVPPLNEVAFSADARIQHDRAAVAHAFVRSVRIIMAAALPFYLGLAVTAEPLVLTALGRKWAEAIPIVRLLALAMPCMTLQVLYSPACDPCGRPGVSVPRARACWARASWSARNGEPRDSASRGSSLSGLPGLSSWRALPVIGASARDVAGAVAPVAVAAMAAAVLIVDRQLPPTPPLPHLAILVAMGAAVYAGWLKLFASATLRELIATVRRTP